MILTTNKAIRDRMALENRSLPVSPQRRFGSPRLDAAEADTREVAGDLAEVFLEKSWWTGCRASEIVDEASDLHVQGFRNIVIALNSSNDFLYVDYDPVGFGTQKALEAIQRNGLYTVVAIFGWGRDRKTAQTIL